MKGHSVYLGLLWFVRLRFVFLPPELASQAGPGERNGSLFTLLQRLFEEPLDALAHVRLSALVGSKVSEYPLHKFVLDVRCGMGRHDYTPVQLKAFRRMDSKQSCAVSLLPMTRIVRLVSEVGVECIFGASGCYGQRRELRTLRATRSPCACGAAVAVRPGTSRCA